MLAWDGREEGEDEDKDGGVEWWEGGCGEEVELLRVRVRTRGKAGCGEEVSCE